MLEGDLKIGFGYWGKVTDKIFGRHAFFILNNEEIVDAMRGYFKSPPTDYIVIRSMNIQEYLNALVSMDLMLKNHLKADEIIVLNAMNELGYKTSLI